MEPEVSLPCSQQPTSEGNRSFTVRIC